MKIIYSLPLLSPVKFQANPAPSTLSESGVATAHADCNDKGARPTFTVEISSDGRHKVENDKYADIERAPLPEDVRQALKNIRKLQERMAEKQLEIQEIMQDDALTEETKKSRQQAAITELQVMESAMSDAHNALNTRMSSHNLDTNTRALAKGLVGMK
jgi:hypothetical protein